MACCRGTSDEVANGSDDARKCRDIPFALLFAAFWGGVISIAGVAFHQGNPAVLLYGLDYDGHVCGKNQPGANLLPYKAQYWVNPNEVIQANGYGFSLSDAKSICLKDCPQLLPNNQLSWVCAYPQDVNTSAWASPSTAPSSLSSWAGAGYNYFTSLAPAAQATSCALQGPCYPVLTSQANVWHTCQTQTLNNLPVNPTAVALLQQCFSCCNVPAAQGTAACNATDVNKLPLVMSWTGNTGPSASANDRVGCLQSCQSLHGSIAGISATSKGSVHPLALALFNSTCSSVGASAAQVPLPNTQDGGAMAAVLNSLASSYKATAFRYGADMLLAWKALVVTGLFLPFIIAFFWIILVKYLTGPLVWMTLLCVDLATLGCTLYCFSKSGNIGRNSFNGIVSYSDANGFSFNAAAATALVNNATTVPSGSAGVTPAVSVYDLGAISKRQMYYLGIASAIMTVITWIFSVILVPRLRVSIATIKVAVDAMRTAPFLALFPLWPGLLLSGFMVWWVALGLFIYSSGHVVQRQCCAQVQSAFTNLFPSYVQLNGGPPACSSIKCGYTVQMNKSLEYTLIYHGFEFLWTTQFVVAFGVLTVSQVVHSSYLHAGGQGVAMHRWPVAHASWVSVRYYLGSMAFGSLVVASFQFFAYVMSYLAIRLKKVADSNRLVRVLLWAATCLVWALEKIVEFMSNNAYAVIAIDGSAFCPAAGKATVAVVGNALRFATLAVVTDAVLFLAKLGTAASSAFFCFVYLDKTYPKGTFSSPLVPVIVVFLTGFAMASLVMGVVHQAVNATILCLIDDEDRNGGTARNAPPALMAATDAGTAWKEEAEKRNAESKGCCSSAPAADGQP